MKQVRNIYIQLSESLSTYWPGTNMINFTLEDLFNPSSIPTEICVDLDKLEICIRKELEKWRDL